MSENSSTTETVDLGKPVAIGKIEKELKQLWKEDDSRTRASLSNVCIYSEKKDALEENSVLLNAVTRENACRGIILSLDTETQDNVKNAWIKAHCHLQGGKKEICSEQVAFEIGGGLKGRLRNLVFSHVDSDLPLNFWWRGELSPRFEERLYSIIDRFIFDSSEWVNPKQSYKSILAASHEVHPRMILHDLEWTRTYCIRNSFARLFDHPGTAEKIADIESVEILAEKSHGVAAGLLIAWLASQAEWEVASADWQSEWKLTFKNNAGKEVQCTVKFEEGIEPIASFHLGLGDDNHISLTRELEAAYLKESVKIDAWNFSQMTPADSDDDAKLVADTLSRSGKNLLFMKILPTLKAMLS